MKRILLFSVLIVFLLVLSSCYNNKPTYDELSKLYDDLCLNYDDLRSNYDDLKDMYSDLKSSSEFRNTSVIDDLWTLEDDMITLYGFFDSDEDFTFEEAKHSFDRLETVYSRYCHY